MKVVKQQFQCVLRVDVILEVEEEMSIGDIRYDENECGWVCVKSEDGISEMRNMYSIMETFKTPTELKPFQFKPYEESSKS